MSSGKRILIVDDEANIRMTLAAILQGVGYQVTTAGDGASALEQFQRRQFDLVFLDLRMPDTDGMTLFRELRRVQPDAAVIILTGHATLDSAVEGVRLGARDYMFKPVNPDRILERTREILAERDQAQRQRELYDNLEGLLDAFKSTGQPRPPTDQASPGTRKEDHSRRLVRGALVLDLHTRELSVSGRTAPLTEGSFHYMETLMRHAPDAVPYQALVSESQGYQLDRREAQEMARWWIHQLRKSIEENPSAPTYILTVRGVGYRLAV